MRRLIRVAASAVAAACLLPNGSRAQSPSPSAQKALVYCPATIDSIGCSNISAALAARYPKGVDRGYDGKAGTVDLRTVDLWQYDVLVVPSLADGPDSKPYALLRDAAIAERLHDALMGRVAMWSGTPDLGSAESANRDQKNALISNLAAWAAGNYGAVKGPGLVTFLDQSEVTTDRYSWVQALTAVNVAADTATQSYASVSALTPTAQQILTSAGSTLAFTNMASFGLQMPNGAAGISLDAIGQTGTSVGGQVVLITSSGGNSGGAIVKTDRNDYAPGTTVVITGSGWHAGEAVTLSLHEDPLVDPDRTFSTTADGSGNINFTGFAPERHNIGVRFILTATGQSSGLRAQTTFTDNVLLKTISFWIHAHQDDWQLFMSDQTRASAQTADNLVFVYVTAGDNGQAASDPYYWQTRESAAKLSVDLLLGSAEWSCAPETVSATLNGTVTTHPIERCVKDKSVSYFLRLPDGGLTGANYQGKTLEGLRDGDAAAIPLSTIETPSTTSYSSWNDLVATIRGIVDLEATRFGTSNIEVNGPEYDRPANPEDHPDHLAVADLVRAAATGRTWSVAYYLDYYIKYLPQNLSDDARTFKSNVFGAYDHVMAREGYLPLIGLPDYQAWLARTYFRSSQTAPVAQVPAPATNLTAQPVSESQIDLAWTDNSSFETGFRVERAADAGGIPGQFASVATVPANTTTYSNTGLAMGTYWYRVMALNASGDASAYTNQVSAQTAAAICVSPSASISPANLAKNLGESASFTAVPTRGTAPFSYRWQKGGVDLSGATGTSYSIAAVTAADVGSYTVIITNSCGSSTSTVATLTLNQRTPVYSALTSPLTVTYGTASVTLGGTIGAGGQFPSGAVSVTLGGASIQAPINTSNGAFTATFATNTLAASATPYPVTYSYAGDASFLAATDNSSTTVTVGKATQTIEFTSSPPNATYGGSYSPAARGGGSGNAITFATTTPTVCSSSGATVQFVGTGSCTITADQAGNANYEAAAQQRQIFSVGAAIATIAITNTNPTYDGTTKSATISVTGANGATLSPSTYSVTYSQSGAPVAAARNAGSYDVTVVVTDANYTGTRTAPFSIARAALQVAADAQTKVYGTADPALTYRVTLGVLANGDALSGVLVRAVGETVAGSPYGITQGTLTAGPNYNLTIAGGSLTITRKNATISSISVSDKSYDGTTTAAFVGGLIAGIVGEDNVTLTAGTATFADKHVGDQKSVTVTGLALAGPDATNYSLASTSASTTASIRARALTIIAAGESKVYDGTPAATVTLSDDRIAGDQLTAGYSSASFTDKNVGTNKMISVSGITLQGSDRGDYTFNTSATATANITARTLDVSAVGLDKLYDGTTTASVTLSNNKLSGDALTVDYSANFADKNVGQSKPVTATRITLGGNDAGNYTVSSTSVTTTASILARPIAVTADAQTKSYGTADPPLTYSLTSGPLASGDAFSGTLQRLAGEDVGAYAIQQGSLTAGANYLLSFVGGSLTIAPATATITIDPATLSVTYDGTAKSVRLTTSPANAAASVSVTYAGSATPPKDAGRYDVLATITSGNYTAPAAHATLVIGQATATIAITDPAPTYKATPTTAVVSVTGANGAALSPSAYTVSYTLGGTAVAAPTNAGHYIVTVAVTDANYSGTQTGALTIAPVALTVSADPQTKVFGAADPAFSYRITNGSLVASDQLSGALTRAFGETVAGSPYAIRQGTLAAGPNYLLSFVESSLTITPGTATIALGNLNQTYDGSAKAATASTSPSGLNVTLTYLQNGVPVASPTDAGSYDVRATIADANYGGSQAGTLIIAKALQTIAFTTTAPSAAMFGGSYAPMATGGASGNPVVFAATPAAVCAISGRTVSFVGLGECVVTADQASSTNYLAAAQQIQHIAVGRATAAITITDPAPVYDGTVKAAAITVTGVQGAALPASGYTVAYTLGSTPVAAPKNVGQYTVTVSVTDPNYGGSQTGTLTISRAAAAIALGNLSQTYDGTGKTATATTTPTGLSVAVSYAQNGVTVANPTNAGSYDVVATVNDANYQGSKTGTLVIAKATQTIAFTNAAPTGASYGGMYSPSATGGASGNPVTFATTTGAVCTVSDGVVSLVGIGDCVVTADQAGSANYADAQTQSVRFAVGRATATIAISDPAPVYDGTAKTATIVVTGINGAALSTSGYTVTYALGGTTVNAPTTAGQYVVTVSVTDPKYIGTQTGNLTIVRGAAVVTLGGLSQTYDGTGKGATATTNPSGLNVSVTYSQNGISIGSPTNAGSYDVLATVSDANYQGSKSGSLVIAPASQTISFTSAAPTGATYGRTYTPTATGGASGAPVVFGTTSSAACTISNGVVIFVGVGDCVVTADQAGSANYTAASQVAQHFAIGRATASVTVTDPTPVYDATAKAAVVSVAGINGAAIPASGYSVTYTLGGIAIPAPTNAGQYAVVVTVTDPNYSGGQAGSLTIKPVELTVTADAQSKVFGAPDPVLTYRITKGALVGADQLGGALTRVAGEAVAGSPYAIQQGTLAVSANYQLGFVGSGLTITPASATLSFDASSLTATYDGNPKAVTATTSPTNLAGDVTITYAGLSAAPTSAGSYDVVATLANGNFTANPARATLVIAKATQIVAFTTAAPTGAIYGGSYMPAVTGGASPNAVVVGTKTPSICSVNGGTVAFTGIGSCTLTANQAGNANYAAAAEQTQSFSIAAAPLTVTADPQSKIYGAPDPALTYRITGGALRSGDQLSGTLSRAPGEAVSGSPYTIERGTLSAGSNYLLTFVGNALTIAPASATITLGNLNQGYDETPKAATASTSPSGLNVTLTYSQNGVAVASPTTAGSYSVVATINDVNYQGTETGTLVIRPASLAITWNPTVTTLKDPATLSTSQLNATVVKPNGNTLTGTVTYMMAGSSVSIGAKVPVGLRTVITASFTSTDPNYSSPPDISRTFDVLNSVDFLISNPFNIIQLSDTKTAEYTAAFLTTANFDASTVDPATALLGDGSDSPSDATVNTNADGTLRYSLVDVNSDGKKDMLLYFKRAAVNASGITTATTAMVLRAQTKDGRKLKGTDKVTVSP